MTVEEIKSKVTPGARFAIANYPNTILEVVRIVERGPICGIVHASSTVEHQCLLDWATWWIDPKINELLIFL